MRRLIHLAAALYPASWRRRYGAEFTALLDDSAADRRALLDVLKGALVLRIQSWDTRTMAISGAIGALVAFGGSFGIAPRYESQAFITVEPPRSASDLPATDYVFRLAEAVTSRTNLVTAISTYKLYTGERARHPIEDVVQSMKDKIFITVPDRQHTKDGSLVFRIGFISDDPVAAQQVAYYLVSQFMDQNVQCAPHCDHGRTLSLRERASVARITSYPERTLITGAGLAIGVTIGIIVARRRVFRGSPQL